jgi:Yip1 domain
MANTTAPIVASSVPKKGLLARFFGMITSPKETYQSVVAYPHWFGMFALTILIIAACSAAPMTTEAGQQAALDNQVTQMQNFGMQVNDQQYARMQKQIKYAPYTAAGGVLVVAPIFALIFTGILFAVFNAALGGESTFKQLFSVWVHSGVISTLGQLFTAPINVIRGSVGSSTNLAVLLPMIEEGSFLGKLLGMIDLFAVWWVIVLAIGLGVLYRRRTQPIAMTLLGVYAVIAIGAAAVMSRLGGTH